MKKFISVMLVAAMAVTALTGCGSNSGSSSKKDADKYYIGGIGLCRTAGQDDIIAFRNSVCL